MVDSAKIDRINIFFFLGLTYKNKYNPSMQFILGVKGDWRLSQLDETPSMGKTCKLDIESSQ